FTLSIAFLHYRSLYCQADLTSTATLPEGWMSSRSLVSVIVIFLNEQRFLQEALDSILAHTYQNWEIMLVDDGSTDDSTQIARQFAASLPEKVRYLEHKGHRNCGMSASRNLGIGKARGQYLAFLDADDVWLPRKLEQQTAILESKPDAGMVYGPTQYWFSWTGAPGDKSRDYIRELGVPPDTLIEPPDLLARFLRNEAKPPGTCSVLARREAVERVGGFEKSFRGLHEDQAFFAKMSFKEPIFVTSQCTAR